MLRPTSLLAPPRRSGSLWLILDRSRGHGAVVWLVDLNPGVLEVVRHAGLDRQLGPDRMLFNTRVAIEHYRALQAADKLPHAAP